MPLLNNRVKPYEFESLFSFCHRTAKANYFESLPQMMKGKDFNKISNYNYRDDNKEMALDDIIERSGEEADRLLLNQFDEILLDKDIDNKMKARVYLRNHTRYCPECLQSTPFHRIYWDLTYLTICPLHKRKLIDRCQDCGKLVNVRNLMKLECSCGFNFKASSIHEPPSSDLIKAQHHIFRALVDEEFQLSINNEVSLERKTFFDFLYKLCVILDDLPFNQNRLVRKITFTSRESLENISQLVEFASSVLSSPNQYFDEFYVSLESIGYEKSYIFGEKLKILKEIMTHEKGGVYYKKYSSCVNSSSRHYVKRRRTVNPLSYNEEYIGIMQAVKILGKSYSTVNTMCELGILKLHETETVSGKRNAKLIRRSEVERISQEFIRCLTLKEVRVILGLYQKDIEQLIFQSRLVATHGPMKNGYPEWYIEPDSVKQLQSYFSKKLQVIGIPADDEAIMANRAVYYGRGNQKFSFVDLLDKVARKEIKGGLSSNDGQLRSLVLNKESFYKYIKKLR